LIYIACVGERVEAGRYYVDKTFQGRKDRIYRSEDGMFRVRPRAMYHSDGSQLPRDLGRPPSYARAVTLLSRDFRYWGKRGTTNYQKKFPRLAELLGRLTQGHRVNLPEATRKELTALRKLAWRSHPTTKVLGPPSEADWAKRCNRTEGECRS
jgi:hypothetical protein